MTSWKPEGKVTRKEKEREKRSRYPRELDERNRLFQFKGDIIDAVSSYLGEVNLALALSNKNEPAEEREK